MKFLKTNLWGVINDLNGSILLATKKKGRVERACVTKSFVVRYS